MKTLSIHIAESLSERFVEQARTTNGQLEALNSKSLNRLAAITDRSDSSYIVVDIPSQPLGTPGNAEMTRAQMLTEFFDRE